MKEHFAIFRIEKHRSAASLAGSHINADRICPHADPARAHLNQVLIGSGNAEQDVFGRIAQAGVTVLPKNVLALEIIIAASPGRFSNDPHDPEWIRFCRRSIEYLHHKFGKENVVACVAQYDESNPHLHVAIVPVHSKSYFTGRTKSTEKHTTALNSRHYIGSPLKLKQMQTEFAGAVGEFGLQRGISGSKAKHTTVHQFYALANAVEDINQEYGQEIQPVDITQMMQELPKGIAGYISRSEVEKMLRKLNRTIQQVNAAMQDTQTIVMQKIAGTALETLNIKGNKAVTRDQKRLQLLEQHLETAHDERVNWKTGTVIRLAAQREAFVGGVMAAIFTEDTVNLPVLAANLKEKGIDMETDSRQQKVWYTVDKKRVDGDAIGFGYQNVKARIAGRLKAYLEKKISRTVWEMGQGVFGPANTPAYFEQVCSHAYVDVCFTDENNRRIPTEQARPHHKVFFMPHMNRNDPESGWVSGSTLCIESVQKKDAEKWGLTTDMDRSVATWGDVLMSQQKDILKLREINNYLNPPREKKDNRPKV